MNILYVSTVCSKRKYEELFKICNGNLLHSIQNFHTSILNCLNEDNDITSLSGLPISSRQTKKKIFFKSKDIEDNITYISPFFVNLPIIKNIFMIFGIMYCTLKWIMLNRKQRNVRIIIDSAYVSVAPMVVFFAKVFKIPVVSIVADIYDYMVLNINKTHDTNFFNIAMSKILKYCWKNYDGFIFLTEPMNALLNKQGRPYKVIEGFAPEAVNIKNIEKNSKKIILYAGGLLEKYGILNLIKAFLKFDSKNFELHFYGSGELVDQVIAYSNNYNNIKYYGNIKHDELQRKYTEAFLLVNPRGNDAEYTKYSFPSKTIDYLLSGTPVLTVKLAGIPNEYYKYLYSIDNNDINTIYNKLVEISMKNDKELELIGKSGREFILNNKSKKSQSKKIEDLLRKVGKVKNE